MAPGPGAHAVVRCDWAALPDAAGQVRALLHDGVQVVLRLAGPGQPDLRALDALARLALCARRSPGTLRLDPEGERLAELVDLAGLSSVLGPSGQVQR